MGGAAPDMPYRKRLRSRARDVIQIHSDDDDEEGNKTRGGVNEVNNTKTSTAALMEKRKQKEGGTRSNKNMMADDREKEKKKTIWNGHNKVESRKKVSITSLVEMKKEKLCSANNTKKMQISGNKEGKGKNRCDCDHKLKKRKESNTLSEKKNKEKMHTTHKQKMWAADSKERKILSGHNRVKKGGEVSPAFIGKEKKGKRLNKNINEDLQSDEDEEEVWNCGRKVKKNGKVATTFSEEAKRKKRPNNTNTEKGAAPLTPVKEKRMSPSESMKMVVLHDKSKGRNVPSNAFKEKKTDTSSGSNYKKRKREEPHSQSKKEKRVRCNASDKESLRGEVQEKKICGSGKEKNNHAPFAFFKIMYNYFEEFLLIPPAVAPKLEDLTNHHISLEDSEGRCSKVQLSVMDGYLAFHQGWDVFVSDHFIKQGEFLLFDCIAKKKISVRIFGTDCRERLSFKSDIKRVEHGVESGPAPQDNNNGNLIGRQCKTKNTSPPRSKKKPLLFVLDSETSAHNEDIVNVTTSDADSTHHVTINTNKDLERVQSGIGSLPDGECGTKCISPPCSEVKTSSEVTVTDAALLTHENDDRVGHELEVQDLDEDLISKQGINSIPLDSITAAEEHHNHSETNVSQNFCRKYAAPGGFRCLEKWWKGIVNSQAALDGTVLIEPENTRKTGSEFVDGYGSIVLNIGNEYFCSDVNHTCVLPVFTMPVKEPSSADRVSECRCGGTEIDHGINEKGASVQIETQGEQLEPVGSIANSQRNNIPVSANTVVLGEYDAMGLNRVGPEGIGAFVESVLTVPVEEPLGPDGISKCGSSRTEINHNVNGKGTIVQVEAEMDKVEQVGSNVCSQSSIVTMHANHVVAHVAVQHFSKQEGRNSINCAIPDSSLPMKDKILELDGHALRKFSLQFCVPDTTQKWIELPKFLPGALKRKRHGWNTMLLKDPMKRLWPVLYQENSVFVGFTAGWKYFVAANNLRAGDLCYITKQPDDDALVYSVPPVYSVLITRQGL
ncbi:unnamed protein product [Urochloa decumbens]|uniref:TF-B3 domain-containing protein n=1 Tax=Urochloa decumbens TaxID=240449 RepID=A0ABC9EJP7_9POAL